MDTIGPLLDAAGQWWRDVPEVVPYAVGIVLALSGLVLAAFAGAIVLIAAVGTIVIVRRARRRDRRARYGMIESSTELRAFPLRDSDFAPGTSGSDYDSAIPFDA